MNWELWSREQAAEVSRLRRKVKALHHMVERRDRRIAKLYERLRESQMARRDRERWYGR